MIAPPSAVSNSSNNNNNNNNKSDSDSDSSDWSDDDDFASRKISINIKPINQINNQTISSSVDELRATVGTWKSLANINLVKPNSRRSHHQSTLQLVDSSKSLHAHEQQSTHQLLQQPQPEVLTLPANLGGPVSICPKLPVAFAVQESFDSKLVPQTSSAPSQIREHLIGHVRMAVPPSLADPLTPFDEQDLEFSLNSSMLIDRIQVNDDFIETVRHMIDGPDVSNQSHKSFRIKMQPVREFARKRGRLDKGSKYFLLPELIRYYRISDPSVNTIDENGFNVLPKQNTDLQINPIDVVSHWLCDLNVTKVRIDIALLKQDLLLTSDDIKNLKVSLEVNGGVNSYHSKPDANWNPLDSRLTWSFANLTDFIRKSSNDGFNSCLAKFNLDDGPSTPSSVSVQFSINNRTLTGTKIALTRSNSFDLVRQKYEVKTNVTEIR